MNVPEQNRGVDIAFSEDPYLFDPGSLGPPSSDDYSKPMANQTNSVQEQINLIGEGTLFEGTLYAESNARASGKIVGTLKVEGKALIAETGVVEGEIIATDATIAGRVQGEIHVEERLVLKSSARIDGTIETDQLVVEEGAQFTGECAAGAPISANDKAQENGKAKENGKAIGEEKEAAPPDRTIQEGALNLTR